MKREVKKIVSILLMVSLLFTTKSFNLYAKEKIEQEGIVETYSEVLASQENNETEKSYEEEIETDFLIESNEIEEAEEEKLEIEEKNDETEKSEKEIVEKETEEEVEKEEKNKKLTEETKDKEIEVKENEEEINETEENYKEEKATVSQTLVEEELTEKFEEEKTEEKEELENIEKEATKSEVEEKFLEEQKIVEKEELFGDDQTPNEYIFSPGWFDENEAGIRTSQVTKITFLKYPEQAPAPTIASWSITGSNGLTAYIDGTEVTIYAEYDIPIYMAENSSFLFSGEQSTPFENLTEIRNLNLLDTSRVTNMSSMFSFCEQLSSVDMSNFNTSEVIDFSEMFYYCTQIETIDVSSFNTENCEKMHDMFYYCTNLKNLDVSNFNTSNVTDMEGMFYSCYSLENINLTNFDTSKVTNMSFMFYMRENDDTTEAKVKKIDLSSFDTQNVETMAQIFFKCKKLKTIYVSDKFVTTKLTDVLSDQYMFFDCTSLVGGNNTTYDANHVDKLYARIDKEGAPGYFTEKENPETPENPEDPETPDDPDVPIATISTLSDIVFLFDLQGRGENFRQLVRINEKLKEPTNPTASGYVFEYWYEGTDDSIRFDFNKAIENTSAKERTLKAKWRQVTNNNTPSSPSDGNRGGSSRGSITSNAFQNSLNNVNATRQGNQEINTSSYGTQAVMNREPLTNLVATTFGNNMSFTTQSGERLQGMQKVSVDGKDGVYYFNDDSTLYCGWMKDENNNFHYFGSDGKMVTNGTVTINNQKFNINANGEIDQANLNNEYKQQLYNQCIVKINTGEIRKNDLTNTWSALITNPITGEKELAKGLTKLVQDDGVNTYYFDNSGNLLLGWQNVNGMMMYFSLETGKLVNTQ